MVNDNSVIRRKIKEFSGISSIEHKEQKQNEEPEDVTTNLKEFLYQKYETGKFCKYDENDDDFKNENYDNKNNENDSLSISLSIGEDEENQ